MNHSEIGAVSFIQYNYVPPVVFYLFIFFQTIIFFMEYSYVYTMYTRVWRHRLHFGSRLESSKTYFLITCYWNVIHGRWLSGGNKRVWKTRTRPVRVLRRVDTCLEFELFDPVPSSLWRLASGGNVNFAALTRASPLNWAPFVRSKVVRQKIVCSKTITLVVTLYYSFIKTYKISRINKKSIWESLPIVYYTFKS